MPESTNETTQPKSAKRPRANGRNAVRVNFGRDGQRLGRYEQTGPGQWQEQPASKNGNRFQFRETGRDDWSVYLHDASRNVRIQLDLHRKQVLYGAPGSRSMRPLYDVLSARAGNVIAAAPEQKAITKPAPVKQAAIDPSNTKSRKTRSRATGRNAVRVNFGRDGQRLGRFEHTGPGQWQEQPANKNGNSFQFHETGRDDWSIYLHDRSRNVRIQLDLHRKLVLYGAPGATTMRPLYNILSAKSGQVIAAAPEQKPIAKPAPAAAQPRANGRDVIAVTVGSQGRHSGQFRQTAAGQWEESSVDPRARRFQFRERGRDDWSVYLVDDSRKVNIQIDLHRKLVLYSDAGNPQPFPIYDVLDASSGTVMAQPVQPTPRSGPVAGAVPPAGGGSTGAGNTGASSKSFCWKDSYGRGAGTVPQSCEPGRERIGLLCYSRCPANSTRTGFDCHSVCPSGMRDDGLFCRAEEYGRGAGYAWKPKDGISDSGMLKRCEKKHGKGNCEMNGAIAYPKCKPGYSAFGCCICRPKTPNCTALGMNPGVDLSCAKKVTIGDPVTGTCPAGEVKDGGLCYPRCNAGYTGVGPVCWTGAPPGWVECGMGAAKDSQTCGQIVFDQVSSVGQVAFTVATAGSGSAATGAATGAGKAARLAELKKKYKALKDAYQRAKPAIDKAIAAKKTAGAAVHTVELMHEDQVTEEDIVRISAEIAAIADPTGVAGTVAAYTYPKCSKYGF